MKSRKSIYSYSVKIIDKPILLNGVTYSQKAKVYLRDKNGSLLEKRFYGVYNVDSLYESIHKGEDINVRDCFISNFSIKAFKKRFNLSVNSFVKIRNFDATNSFFESDRFVDFSNAEFIGDYTLFQNAHFGTGSLTFLRTKFQTSLVDFSEASFGEGNNSFKYTEFSKGLITFENASFINGNLSFVNATFNDGKASFRNVNFGNGDVDFKYASFGKGIVNFERSIFSGAITNFSKVDFGVGKVNFRKAKFGNSTVSFDEIALASSKMVFRKAQFQTLSFKNSELPDSTLILDEALFGTGNVSFWGVNALEISLRNSILSSYIDFRVQKVTTIDFSNAIVHNILDFKKGITEVQIDKLYLYGIRNLGKIFIDWEQNNVLKLIGEQPTTTLNQKAEQYRILKEGFRTMGEYDNEDKAYVAFKRNELLARVEESKNKQVSSQISTFISSTLETLVFDWMGKYATSPIRVLISIFSIYGAFSFVYVLFEKLNFGSISCTLENESLLNQFIDAFYFSAITFLTIGYGDCLPTGLFKIIAPLEGWVGVFMMSYFTVAFVRKILR